MYICMLHIATHSAGFYDSPFDSALVFSIDAGGNDGTFNVYKASRAAGVPPRASPHSETDPHNHGTAVGVGGCNGKPLHQNLGLRTAQRARGHRAAAVIDWAALYWLPVRLPEGPLLVCVAPKGPPHRQARPQHGHRVLDPRIACSRSAHAFPIPSESIGEINRSAVNRWSASTVAHGPTPTTFRAFAHFRFRAASR
jgi:hypothetical protein